jgi:hypothetical protein
MAHLVDIVVLDLSLRLWPLMLFSDDDDDDVLMMLAVDAVD